LVDQIYTEYGIEVPLVDLFKWGTDESSIKKITSATDVGPSSVNGITCEHYAFRQEGIDWQIWIQLGDFPLPKKFVIRTLTDDARPQHTSTLTWNLARRITKQPSLSIRPQVPSASHSKTSTPTPLRIPSKGDL
jgi:hypothetical protein